MAIAAAALRVGSMLAKTGGAIAKGGKLAMKKGGTVLKKSKKIAGNVKKSVKKGAKISKEKFMEGVNYLKKERERRKREAEERALEQANKSKEKPSAKKSAARGGGMLQRLISFISTILVGWIVTNLPKIIESVKGVIEKIKQIYNNITGLFGSVGEFFSGIKDSIGNVINRIKDIDFSKIGEKIKEKITGLKDAFTNLIANVGKGLGILKSKKNEDPEKLAKSGIGGDASAESNNSSKKADDKNSDVDGLKKDTNKLKSDTNELEGNLTESLNKAENEMSKVDVNVSIEQVKESGDAEKIEPVKKDASKIDQVKESGTKKSKLVKKFEGDASKSTIQTLDGKTYKPGDKGYKGELKKAQSAVKKSMKNVTKDSGKFISNIKKADITKSITKNKKSKNIVVDNIIPAQNQVAQSQRESQTQIIVLGKSLNSMVKENILLDAAYT